MSRGAAAGACRRRRRGGSGDAQPAARVRGYTVRQYASGGELLDAADSLQEGSILLDIDMADPDGFAVRRELARKAIGLPVIMMSGSGDLTLLAMKAGVADFMQKPFGRSELLSALSQLAARSECHA